MGQRFSSESNFHQDISLVEPQSPRDHLSSAEEEDVSSCPLTNPIYLVVHNNKVQFYIHDETLLELQLRSFVRSIFDRYVTSWGSYNYYISQIDPFEEESDTSLFRTIRLISRSKHFFGMYDQIEEVIEVYRVYPFSVNEDSQDENKEVERKQSSSEEESESEAEESESEAEESGEEETTQEPHEESSTSEPTDN